MGYLFLAFALLSGAAKGYCGKKTSGIIEGYKKAILANMLRMAICIIIGAGLIVTVGGGIGEFALGGKALLISAFSGVFTALFVVIWLVAVKSGAYMMIDVFLTMGCIVPLAASSLLFNEYVRPLQWVGFTVLIIASVIMCSYNNTIKTEKLTIGAVVSLILCGLSSGCSDFSQKLFVKSVENPNTYVFNFYTYIFAAATMLIVFSVLSRKGEKENIAAVIKPISGYIIIMAICLFANSFFHTMAAQHLDSAKLYPLSHGCGIVISTAMSAVLFKEKLNLRCIVGIITAFAGLLLINVIG